MFVEAVTDKATLGKIRPISSSEFVLLPTIEYGLRRFPQIHRTTSNRKRKGVLVTWSAKRTPYEINLDWRTQSQSRKSASVRVFRSRSEPLDSRLQWPNEHSAQKGECVFRQDISLIKNANTSQRFMSSILDRKLLECGFVVVLSEDSLVIRIGGQVHGNHDGTSQITLNERFTNSHGCVLHDCTTNVRLSKVPEFMARWMAAWQLDCKRFITNRGDIISDIIIIPALMMSPRLVMKRLQSNCQARRTDQQSISAPELPIFHNIADNKILVHHCSTTVSICSNEASQYKSELYGKRSESGKVYPPFGLPDVGTMHTKLDPSRKMRSGKTMVVNPERHWYVTQPTYVLRRSILVNCVAIMSPSFRTYPSAMDPRIEPMCNPIYFVDTPLFVSPVVDAGIRHSSIFIVIRGVRYGSDQVVSLQGIHWRLRRVTCSVVSLTAQWLSSRYLLSYWRILRMRQVFKNDTSYDADIYRSILFSFIRFVLQVVVVFKSAEQYSNYKLPRTSARNIEIPGNVIIALRL
ncbi:hypothetical protein CLF_110802 [Clonorchis sinensis]|uniref:Uncharacterized protein n=1 Tax=Clonorchis sinensis TaxID=79923 RepID=G7YTW3_CLOSI|nr:hypothetical protein CLF_110802 [Clonorchis sinensis]